MAEPVWMLDTNVLSDMIRNSRGELIQRLTDLEPDAVCTSIVVACELRFGARRNGSDVLTHRVEQLLDTLTVLPLDKPGRATTLRIFAQYSNEPARPSAAMICSLQRMRAPAT